MMRAVTGLLVCASALLLAFVASADAPALRWSRPIDTHGAKEGWVRVALPDDVLAACRPGSPDLRVKSAAGSEVPFVVEPSLGGLSDGWPVRDVESSPGRETTAIVDRGPHPQPAADATIVLDATEFLKPVVIEASDDARDWKEIARGSIFATSVGRERGRMTRLRFAPSDRRYWRLRLDDRNGPPIAPTSVTSSAIVRGATPRELALDVRRTSSEGGETTYELTLPSANLGVAALRILPGPADAAFVRRVTVSERVLFRDEVTRRTVGSAEISRGPAGESLGVPLGELRGPTLEIRAQDGASPPLTITQAIATVAPRSVLFFAPSTSLPATLEYGSALLDAPHYDLAAALAHGRPDPVTAADLGVAVDHGASNPVGLPPHGALVDESRWLRKAALDLPSAGGVVYVALDGIDASGGLRVVDATSREVPFLYERSPHRARTTASAAITEQGTRTVATLAGLPALQEIDAIDLTATSPDYFVRAVTVVEATRDARGPVGERVLGGATWERKPGEPAAPLTVVIAAPTQATFEVRVENGSNAPIALGPVTVERSVQRIDFVCAPGESLSLLAGNPAAGAPAYDLALLSDALLALPAQAARLEPARDLSPGHPGTPKLFWVAVIVAGLGVGAALARALGTRASATKE